MKNPLGEIDNVAIYPIISLMIFFVFFVVLTIYLVRMDRKSIRDSKQLPLLDDELMTSDNSPETSLFV